MNVDVDVNSPLLPLTPSGIPGTSINPLANGVLTNIRPPSASANSPVFCRVTSLTGPGGKKPAAARIPADVHPFSFTRDVTFVTREGSV